MLPLLESPADSERQRTRGAAPTMENATGMAGEAARPLAGVRVVDLTRVMTGPYCTMMLGDLGADVVKVELPGRGDDTRGWGPPFVGGESVYFMTVNRNKRSVALDLKSEGGQAALWRLIDGADVLVENFSPGTLARLGFGAEAVRARHPRLVYAAISGFGQSGPDHDRVAYDLIVQGMSGMMSVTGHPDGPPTRLGVPIADIGAGMFAAYAIAAALYRRERTGEGCLIDTSMLGGQVALLTYQAGGFLATGEPPARLGNAHPMIAPYDTFACADGHVNIAVGNDAMWRRFCAAIERPDLAADETFAANAGRVTNKPALYAAIEPELRALPRVERVALLDCTGGWYTEQRWEGVSLDALLAATGARGATVEVRSETGYARRFPRDEAGGFLLATGVAGAPLDRGHGAPLRLVAPGRRGYDWVKWVTEVRVDDRSSLDQAPLPLQ